MLPKTRLQVVPLEDRTTPASASFLAGVLTITPDVAFTGNNVMSIVHPVNTPDGFLEVHSGTTKIFDGLATGQLVKSIVLDAKATTSFVYDDVLVAGGELNLSGGLTVLGGLDDSLRFDNTWHIGGKMTYTQNKTSPNAALHFFSDQSTFGSVQMTLAGGSYTLTGQTAGDVTVLGGSNREDITLRNPSVGGNMILNLGEGDNNILGVPNSTPMRIGKGLAILTGSGRDRVLLDVMPVIVGGDALIKLGAAPAANGNELFLSALTVGRNLTVLGGVGADGGFFGTTRVGGTATFNLGDGANSLRLGPTTVGKGLNFVGKDGADSIELAGDLNVGSSLIASLGNGRNELVIENTAATVLTVGADFSYVGGTGSDTIDFADNTQAFGLNVGRNVTLTLGTLLFGDEENSVQVGSLRVWGNFNMLGSSAGDQLFTGPLFHVGGTAKLQLSDGDNVMNFSGFNDYVGTDLLYQSGKGFDNVGTSGLVVGRHFTINVGSGNFGSGTTFSTLSVGGSLTLQSADSGSEFVNMGNEIHVGGNVAIALGAGNNDLDWSPQRSRVQGNFAYTGLGGFDNLQLDNLNTGKSVTLNVGDGSNRINMRNTGTLPTIIGGSLTFSSGIADDEISIEQLAIQGGLTLNMGAGFDRAAIRDTSVHSAVLLNLGEGNDVLALEVASPSARPTSFASSLTVNAGGGDDEVQIGSNVANRKLIVAGPAIFNGGLGQDTLGSLAGHDLLNTNNTEDFEVGDF